MLSIIQPKKPKDPGWISLGRREIMGFENYTWIHRESQLAVMSAVEVASDANDIARGPEYHVSISRAGMRCTSAEAKWVLDQFDMDGSEEDNHVPNGFVRNFWLPVNESLIGVECPCKATEPEVKEDKGDFVWRPISI